MSKLTAEDVLDLIDATGAPANAIVNAFDEASTLLKIIAPQPPKEAILAQAEFMLARRDCKGERDYKNADKKLHYKSRCIYLFGRNPGRTCPCRSH